ncbi:GNAT family N-acetyltransferase [Hyunsoonleella ulvae]|uniref:GNAT family N-acetyltransferase n=1 Tax=Hyunsoonleella ulvae TaxID=2799948 RepID=UPI00193AD2BD|nr:GNAT family N-acetyltransferase [Hyunsoonleella ulvae]
MSDNKRNIEVFPIQLSKNSYQKLFIKVHYCGQSLFNKDVEEEYKNYYSLPLVPEYFNLSLRDEKFLIKKIPQYNWGYSILLNEFKSADDYILKQFKSKKRSIIKRYVNRLEECLNIDYKFYHGDINHVEYLFLMDNLHRMITNRFNQLNETHKNLSEWNYLKKSTFAKILSKDASLFVIFNNDEPIEISLNYHYDKILFSYVSSFDIDYTKFGLGHVEIYKQIEWCIENGYKLFEMGVGGTDYKRRWSNNIYQYYHYLVYSEKQTFFMHCVYIKYLIKEFLKSKKINEFIPRMLFLIRRERKNYTNHKLDTGPISDVRTINKKKLASSNIINILSDDYKFLKKNILDFLYLTISKMEDVKVYEVNGREFLIIGKNYHQTVRILKL